jgi:protein gp37
MTGKYWNEPLRWNRKAERFGTRLRVFTSSMTDVFLNHPTIDAERNKLWPLIKATPSLTWQVLTKHPERLQSQLPGPRLTPTYGWA